VQAINGVNGKEVKMEISKDAYEQFQRDTEKLLRLEKVIDALVESNSTIEAIRTLIYPFADGLSWVYGCSSFEESHQWYEERIFNESRLYEALGKDDGRSILGIWNRFHAVCELLVRIKREENKK